MRIGLGLVSLLVVLALGALLTRKSVDATHMAVPAMQGAPAHSASAPATVRDQSRQIQEDYKKALDKALNPPRSEQAD